MLWFCAGTAGELIKLYPLMRLADDRGLPWRFVSTGQSAVNLWRQWEDFRLPRERAVDVIATRSDLRTPLQALFWFWRGFFVSKSKILRALKLVTKGRGPLPSDHWIVHGDTLSTLQGAVYGRRLGLPVVHVEAGLRSEFLLRPFPEEINRRIVSRLACVHFTQDSRASENLRRAGVKGRVQQTFGNTLIDALSRAKRELSSELAPIARPYVVANIHRNENLGSPERWKMILETLKRSASRQPVYLVLHPPTQEKLDQDPDSKKLLEDAGVKLLPRQKFTHFVRYLDDADYVLSDGGSNQEECFYLGLPCLILRDTTERFEGIAEGSCVLSRFDPQVIDRFLAKPSDSRRPPFLPEKSPSSVILDHLMESQK